MSGNRQIRSATVQDVGDDADGEEAQLPEHRITGNMLVSYNLAYFRKAAGLSQMELGERLGWTNVAVSAAERSWDGKRVRKFNADEIVRLARIFGVPVPAMFMPPADDGDACRYIVDTGDGDMAVGEFFVSAVAESGFGSSTLPGQAYANDLITAMAKYTDPGMHETIAKGLRQSVGEEQLDSALRRAVGDSSVLESLQDAIGELRSDNGLLREFLVTTLRETEGGRERLAALDREQRRQALDGIGARWRADQSRLAALGRELFGDRGPATREEIDQVCAKARERGFGTVVPVIRQRLADGSWEIPDPGEPGENGS